MYKDREADQVRNFVTKSVSCPVHRAKQQQDHAYQQAEKFLK